MFETDAYVLHSCCAHRSVYEAIRQVHLALASSGNETHFVEGTFRQLANLDNALARHFAEEEGGACLDEAVYRCPRLQRDAQRLQSQRQGILNAIRAFGERVLSMPVADRDEITARFDRIADQIQQHVEAESHLIGRAFGYCLDSE